MLGYLSDLDFGSDDMMTEREPKEDEQMDGLMTLETFWLRHAEWSRKTFGSDIERGPEGPLKHLAKEVLHELLGYEKEEVEDFLDATPRVAGNTGDLEEYADLILLAFDSCRRAGFDYSDLVLGCYRKLEVNRSRRWNKPSPDQPVEHIRDEVQITEGAD